jgi:hypothetical protein
VSRAEHAKMHITQEKIDFFKNLKRVCGEKVAASVLTEANVIEIRRRYKRGENAVEIWKSGKYPVTYSSLIRAIKKKSWKHITTE